MFQGPLGLEPDALLGVLVVEEEPVLVGVAEALDFLEALADLSAGVQDRRLRTEIDLEETVFYGSSPDQNELCER